MPIYECRMNRRTLEFFTSESTQSQLVWNELVYQNRIGQLGFNLDTEGKIFLKCLIDDGWCFDRNKGMFIELNSNTLNWNNLHNEAAIVALFPDDELIASFHELEYYRIEMQRNQLRQRLGRQTIEIIDPMLLCCGVSETRCIAGQCISSLTSHSHAAMLLRSSEYGLTATLFSNSLQSLDRLLAKASDMAKTSIISVVKHEELPCW